MGVFKHKKAVPIQRRDGFFMLYTEGASKYVTRRMVAKILKKTLCTT